MASALGPGRADEALVELLHAEDQVGHPLADRLPHLLENPHALALVFHLGIDLGVAAQADAAAGGGPSPAGGLSRPRRAVAAPAPAPSAAFRAGSGPRRRVGQVALQLLRRSVGPSPRAAAWQCNCSLRASRTATASRPLSQAVAQRLGASASAPLKICASRASDLGQASVGRVGIAGGCARPAARGSRRAACSAGLPRRDRTWKRSRAQATSCSRS